jgi:hypothetical protein
MDAFMAEGPANDHALKSLQEYFELHFGGRIEHDYEMGGMS